VFGQLAGFLKVGAGPDHSHASLMEDDVMAVGSDDLEMAPRARRQPG